MASLPEIQSKTEREASSRYRGRQIRDIKLVRLLGEGAFAQVWLGENADKHQLAVKVMDRRSLRRDRLEDQVALEIRIQGRLQHPNCLPLIHTYQSDKHAIPGDATDAG